MKKETNRRKTYFVIFTALCMAICLVPFICMTFARSDETIGNELSISWPSLTREDGKLNTGILDDMGSYFEHHFAFRPELISADAVIQEKVFRVSNTDTVITGKDGWLYYSSTLGDYLGRDVLSERGMWSLGHNLRLMQDYAESHGARFLVMVPPNKNSLYGENMPYYYSVPMGDSRNRDLLKGTLEEAGVNYLDLFDLFESQEEVLYLKEDSHWNNKGALLVYNAALDQMKKAHETYEYSHVVLSRSHEGDLRAMIYPAISNPEYDFTYDQKKQSTFNPDLAMGELVSVEDFRIESTKENAGGRLLMYRDSFANTLIPFMSEAFGNAYYSKAVPSDLVGEMDTYKPDHVIIEKVERNIYDFVTSPAIITAPELTQAQLEDPYEIPEADVKTDYCQADRSFAEISGSVPEETLEKDSRICIRVTDKAGNTSFYEAYTLSVDGNDGGFAAFIPLSGFGTIEELQSCGIDIFRASGIDEAAAPQQAEEGSGAAGLPGAENSDSSGLSEVSRVAFPSCADPNHGYYEITWSDGSKTYEEY